MKVFVALMIGTLLGTVIGIFAERQLYSTSVICSEIPSCPRCPSCPYLQIDQTSLNSCLKTVDSLVNKINGASSELIDCGLSLSVCNAEAQFWQQKYIEFQCE